MSIYTAYEGPLPLFWQWGLHTLRPCTTRRPRPVWTKVHRLDPVSRVEVHEFSFPETKGRTFHGVVDK